MSSGGLEGRKRSNLRSLLSSSWTSATLLVLLFMSVMAQAWGLSLFGSRIDHAAFGSWSEAVGSIASSAAVIIAVGSLASDQRRRAEERRVARVNEITRVFCWLEPRLAETGGRLWILHFENHTNMVVTPWKVSIARDGLPPLVFANVEYGPIRPRTTEMLLDGLSDVGSAGQPRIEFEFTDADRQNWRSDDKGLHPA